MAKTATQKLDQQEFQEESVSTGRSYYSNETLPYSQYDWQQPEFSHESARRMRQDAEVHAAVEYVLDAMLSDGIDTVTAVYETDSEFDLAEEISAFVRRSMFESCKFFLRTFKELMRGAFYNGHKVGEIVLRLETGGMDTGKLVLDKIKVKPNRATAFIVDEFFNVLGLVAVHGGQSAIGTGRLAAENIIPVEKFLICTFETEDADPRGVAQVKAALEPACDNRENRLSFKLWRKKVAVRSFVATTPKDAKPVQERNPDGSPKLTSAGVPVTKSAIKATSETLAKMQSDTVAVFPDGTVVTPLDANGTGELFERGYKLNNQSIRKAILLQSGATGESDKGGLGKAGKEVDERVLNRRINSFRRDRELELYGLAQLLVSLNYGADKAHLTPEISLGDAEKQDFAGLLDAYQKAGFKVHPSQFEEIDRKLGLPKRDTSKDDNSGANDGNQPAGEENNQ